MRVDSLSEQLLFTTVRIETVEESGELGVGTGFILALQKEKSEVLFLVTNRHLVEHMSEADLTFTLARDQQPDLGMTCRFNVTGFRSGWHFHPDNAVDIAVCPFVPILDFVSSEGHTVYFRSIPISLFPDEKLLSEVDAIENCVFIGYPNGIWDDRNNLPVVRRAITAAPVTVDFQGKPQFLIDGSVFPGSSGSPVFLHNPSPFSPKTGGMVVGARFNFLGILSSGFFRREQGRMEMGTIPTAQVQIPVTEEMLDLGVVLKWSVVLETVESWMESRKRQVGPK
jgi:hypothetical protein